MAQTEVEITAELVRGLLRDRYPDLADHPLRLGARGWGNQLRRLGDDLAVRLPWATQSADALLHKEHAWLPALGWRVLRRGRLRRSLRRRSRLGPRRGLDAAPDGAADRFHSAYRPAPETATLRRLVETAR